MENEIQKIYTLVIEVVQIFSTLQCDFRILFSVFMVKTSLQKAVEQGLYNINVISMKNNELKKANSKRMWNKEEDDLLISLVSNKSFHNWTVISQEFNKKYQNTLQYRYRTRTNKQCRERWQNNLNPLLNNNAPWTDDQHRTLFRLLKQHHHQWCQLTLKLQNQGFPRRGDNSIKNYFYNSIKRQIKKMNQIIKQNNRETKNIKIQWSKYRKRYSQNPHFNLQLEILSQNTQQKRTNINISSSISHLPKDLTDLDLVISNKFYGSDWISNLHIIKQLDFNLISKILLIAQEKANKKYIISQIKTKQLIGVAWGLREEFIQLMMVKDQPLDKDRVKKLAIKMLEISRRCKNKKNKEEDSEQSQIQQPNMIMKNKTKLIEEIKTFKNNESSFYFQQISNCVCQDQQNQNEIVMGQNNSFKYLQDSQKSFSFGIKPSLYLGKSLNQKQSNSSYLEYSNFLNSLNLKKSIDRAQFRQEHGHDQQFIKLFRHEEQYNVDLDSFPKIANLKIYQDSQICGYEYGQRSDQVKFFNEVLYENSAKPILTSSWARSLQLFSQRYSDDKNCDFIQCFPQ